MTPDPATQKDIESMWDMGRNAKPIGPTRVFPYCEEHKLVIPPYHHGGYLKGVDPAPVCPLCHSA